MANETEKLTFKFYLIMINLNLNSHIRVVGTILDSPARQYRSVSNKYPLLVASLKSKGQKSESVEALARKNNRKVERVSSHSEKKLLSFTVQIVVWPLHRG